MKTSENIDKVVEGLQEFQHEVENPKKSKKAYDYKYAPLDKVIDTVKPALKKHGLSFSQSTGYDGDKITVQTIIWHKSGQYIAFDKLGLPRDDVQQQSKVQSAGSSITYARRYSLSAALGIASEEDTDARPSNPSSKDNSGKNRNKKPAKNKDGNVSVKAIRKDIQENIEEYGNNKSISDKQHGTIKGFFNDMGINDDEDQHNIVAKIIDRDVNSIEKLSMSEAGPIVDRIFNNKKELESLVREQASNKDNEKQEDTNEGFMELVTNIKDRVENKDLTETTLLKWLSNRSGKDFETFDNVPQKWLEEMVKDSFWDKNEEEIKLYGQKDDIIEKAKKKIENKEVEVAQVYTWFSKQNNNDDEYESLAEVPVKDLKDTLNKEFWDENLQEIDDTIPF